MLILPLIPVRFVRLRVPGLLAVLLLLLARAAVAQTPGRVLFDPTTEYARRCLANDSTPLLSINHRNFRLYYPDSSYAARHLDRLTQELDAAYARILDVLQVPSYDHGIHLIAVDSREAMLKLMGMRIKGGAAVADHLVFFVFNDQTRPQFRHEIFHLISYQLWGSCINRLLDEGAATYTDNTCFYDNPINAINARLLSEHKLFDTLALAADFGAQAKQSDVIAYLQAAGLVKYLYERYGLARFRQLWTEGFDHFEAIYGLPLARLDREWRLYLRTLPPAPEIDLTKLMKEGCG